MMLEFPVEVSKFKEIICFAIFQNSVFSRLFIFSNFAIFEHKKICGLSATSTIHCLFKEFKELKWISSLLTFLIFFQKLTELELYEYQELVEKLVNMMKDINDNDRIVVNVDVEPFERTMIERGFLKEISAKSDPEYKYKLCVS